MRSVKSVLLLALFSIGCGGADAFQGPATIDGIWAEDFTIAGSAMGMDLTSSGSIVSGSGEWRGEAGPSGGVAIRGTIDGILVHLDLTFTQILPQAGPTTTEHFDGRFTGLNALEGSVTTDTPGQPVGHTSFHRAGPGDR